MPKNNEFKKYHVFIRDIAAILGERPENLTMDIDIWGHYDAVYPVFRVYTKADPENALFVGETLELIKDQAWALRARMDEKG